MMNAELTAENRPACMPPDSALSAKGRNRTTHEDERRIQILVVLFRVIPVKLRRFPAVHSEEVRPRVVSPQWIEEFFEGGMEAGSGSQKGSGCYRSPTLDAPLRIYLDDHWLWRLRVFPLAGGRTHR